MLISLSWLENYVHAPAPAADLAEALTMAGVKVERVLQTGYSDPHVVVGRVVEVRRHPDAGKLRLCRVEVGGGATNDIVCGAPNVAEGQWVLVALPGARLPDGSRIKSTKIRGQRSDGMICSEKELGIGDDAAGIKVLDGEYSPGQPIAEALPGADTVLEIEVTPNRPDLLSHIGVAREVAAIYQVPLELPFAASAGTVDREADFTVTIENADDCRRYVGRRIRNIRIGPSPAWLVNILRAIGLGSVNNVVDVTNYVMMETGQPIHAFDFERIGGSSIVVRRARDDERFAALDGRSHRLSAGDLVIADESRALALAGVIGGLESAVTERTTELLIESAHFNPTLVRRTRRRLNVATDASYRFERGADPDACRLAAERAAALLSEVAGGTAGDLVDVYARPLERKPVGLRRSACQRILGTGLEVAEIEHLLGRLGFDVRRAGAEHVSVTAPSFRADIAEEADLIEEVARLYGYNRIGKGWSFRTTTYAELDEFDRFREQLASHLAARGFTEVIGSAFTDGTEVGDFDWPGGDSRRQPVTVRNPLSANHRFLRTSLLPGMLDIVRRNLDQGSRRLRIFEEGKVFIGRGGQLPDERNALGLVVTAPDGTDFWNRSKSYIELFDIKEDIEVMSASFNVDLAAALTYHFEGARGTFSYADGKDVVIEGGILSQAVSSRYDFEQAVWHACVDLDAFCRLRVGSPRPKPLPAYPSSWRDLSLLARQNVRYEQIEKSLVKSGGRLLESLRVFDVYRGPQVAEDERAYGVRLTFRSPEKTLTDREIDGVIDRMLAKLKNELGVTLRQ